jgi:hypothetical protein
MQITCPTTGCHRNATFTTELVINDYEQGELCDHCGADIYRFNPAAEADWEEFVERRKEREHAMVVGIFIGYAAASLLIWLLT